ncbi:MAG: DUF2062 domain-containing protein [Geothrix sp.]|uniref:DUF2062 domain-containing protein n=1 Tax=Geothrix sp. TaxID=1962974 RepID=UPI0017A937A7|nr:DUF2062 domain-containing protein [Geothrix sp.]NWJ42119.1 DUF2062 domain-containing protein [Geothrix sp.]WIL19915.1 MAG: DUF2062 domain-containing protein [Geothrix sp.]
MSLRRWLWEPLVGQLRQGLSPGRMAWSLALGLGAGVSPLVGTSTGLCIFLALAFKLNQVVMQVANYLAYPLQLLLLIPFIRLGEKLFGAPRLPLSVEVLSGALRADPWGALHTFWTSLWHAGVAWGLTAPLGSALLALLLQPLFRWAARRFQQVPA